MLALQNAQQIWGGVAAAIAPGGRDIFVPGFDEAGSPAFMRERVLQGLHRFFVFQTAMPAPEAIRERIQTGIAFDYPALTDLIAFYRAQPAATRRLYLLDVVIGEA